MTALETTPDETIELLKIDEVCQLTKLSKATVWNKLNPDSKYYDPLFPKQVYLSKKSVAWLKQEIIAWVDELKQQRQITSPEREAKPTIFS